MPRYYGEKLGKVVKAIAIDDVHDWPGLQKATYFTEKELNYHLRLLFEEEVLIKKNREYYLTPDLLKEYRTYYSSIDTEPIQTTASKSNNLAKIKPINTQKPSNKTEPQTILKREQSSGINLVHLLKLSLVIACLAVLFFGVTNLITNPASSNNQESSEQNDTSIDSTPNTNLDTTPDTTPDTRSPDATPYIPPDVTSKTPKIDTSAKVVYVQDGDTFKLDNGLWVRLADINAPEENETGYQSAKNALMERILGETVFLDIDSERDSHDRLVCVVYTFFDSKYKNINYELVISDFADYDSYDNNFDHTEWSLYEEFDSSDENEIPSWAVYIGNKVSNKYHTLSCTWGEQINSSNRIYFKSKTEAESQDYEPCDYCLPSPLNPPPTAKYVGNKASKKYHTLDCEYGKTISPENRIFFSSKIEAENAGYTPCQVCLKTASSGSSSGGVIGNKSSMIYHKPSCYYVTQMSDSNKVYFASEADAIKAGYRACNFCKP